MSWDVLLLRLPESITSVRDLPDDYTPPPLGRLPEVLATVSRAAPGTDLSDPTWGTLLGPAWSIELGIGGDDPVDSVMLHVRGSGDDVLTPVLRLADALGCKALDCSTGDLVSPRELSGWHGFQEFRDRVIGR
ncbi:hypothetical protein ACWCPT_11060 [Streptomyces sp. NPDC002308]